MQVPATEKGALVGPHRTGKLKSFRRFGHRLSLLFLMMIFVTFPNRNICVKNATIMTCPVSGVPRGHEVRWILQMC